MSYDEKQLSAREPFTEDELATYRTRLRLNIFRQLRALFRRRQQESGLTQKELARRLGADEGLISRRLKGETNLTIDTLCDLARAMSARLDVKVTCLSDVTAAETRATTSRGDYTCRLVDDVVKAAFDGQRVFATYALSTKWISLSAAHGRADVVASGIFEYGTSRPPESKRVESAIVHPRSWTH